MTDAEKIAAFDTIALAFTHQGWNDLWIWWNPKPVCGAATPRATREEAVADLVEFATIYKPKVYPKPTGGVSYPPPLPNDAR